MIGKVLKKLVKPKGRFCDPKAAICAALSKLVLCITFGTFLNKHCNIISRQRYSVQESKFVTNMLPQTLHTVDKLFGDV